MSLSTLPLLCPTVPGTSDLLPYLLRIDASRHYTNFGPLVKELETRLATRFRAQTAYPMHVATVSNATCGIELALLALDLPPGSRVVVPALTFVATLTAVIRAGHIPVIADVDPATWLITPEIVASAVKATGARAAVVVSTFGRAQCTRAWSAYQQQSGVKIVIDAAGAFGSQWVDAPDIPVIFSMHATKSLVAGEGGFVVCGVAAFTAKVAQMSNFGINLDHDVALPVGYLTSVGTNAKLSEYHAAVALASLDKWDIQARSRLELHCYYRDILERSSGASLTWQAGEIPAGSTIFCVRLGSAIERARLEALCAEESIATRRWYQPLLNRHAPEIGPIHILPTPRAEAIAADLIGLPFFLGMTEQQIDRVVQTVSRAADVAAQSNRSSNKSLSHRKRLKHG